MIMLYAPHMRVLIIDDEPSICRALEIALGRAGFEPVISRSGDAALALLRERHFDAMLVDLRIPDLRGDVIFQLAAALQPHLKTATLFMTGDITEKAQRLIESCGCLLVRKPFDLSDIVDALHALAPRVRHDVSA
jgi:DNA-binding response OmpR family regulator